MLRRRIETSKKILIFCDVLTALTTIATFAGLFMGHDLTAIVEVDKGIYALTGAAHSFYYWKAKAENMAKYGQEDCITMKGEDNYDE